MTVTMPQLIPTKLLEKDVDAYRQMLRSVREYVFKNVTFYFFTRAT